MAEPPGVGGEGAAEERTPELSDVAEEIKSRRRNQMLIGGKFVRHTLCACVHPHLHLCVATVRVR